MPHELLPTLQPGSLAADAASLRMLASDVETYLTIEDWRAAMDAGRAPSYMLHAFSGGHVLARRRGPEPASKRWHRVTPAQALGDVWPPRLGMVSGEACEEVDAWHLERDTRLPMVALPAPTHTDLMVTPESIPDLVPADDARDCDPARLSADAQPVRYLMSENAPRFDLPDWRKPALLMGALGLLVLLLVGVCS